MGCGVSGGEEGARYGPSLMPGGAVEAWPHVKNIFQVFSIWCLSLSSMSLLYSLSLPKLVLSHVAIGSELTELVTTLRWFIMELNMGICKLVPCH